MTQTAMTLVTSCIAKYRLHCLESIEMCHPGLVDVVNFHTKYKLVLNIV
jgi:uncharacterized protein YbgA (DUF1722 family)